MGIRKLFLLLLFVAPQATAESFESTDVFVESRGVQVPATIVVPHGDGAFPLVVMAHGHGGSRNESGIFKLAAEALAARGVASIRMDFPGCGDSTESFANNNLGNMLKDIEASRDYAVGRADIDGSRVGLLGWSMGGRLSLLLSDRNDEFDVIAVWAPSALSGAGRMVDFFGGEDEYRESRAIAERDGWVPFTTRWGQPQEIGIGFFRDMESSEPLDHVKEFEGSLFVLVGDLDDVTPPHVAEAVVHAAGKTKEVARFTLRGSDHGLGVFSNEPHLTEEVVRRTTDFIVPRL